jgi:flagellar basal-body rod modification protein FlgD
MDVTPVSSASQIQGDYMKLLVTQLQNQNPLDPVDNKDMASQLAQFSQLQQLETMNSNFAKELQTAEQNYATSLIGKQVAYIGKTETGDSVVTSAKIDGVGKDADGKVVLTAGTNVIEMDSIVSIMN